METWSNNACLGYTILAAKAMGMTDKQITELVNEMQYQFDMTSVEEAEQVYGQSPY